MFAMNVEHPKQALCEELEKELSDVLESVEKERKHERSHRLRAMKAAERAEALKAGILALRADYKFRVKMPKTAPAPKRTRSNYGWATKIVRKLLREAGGGTFAELRDFGLSRGLLTRDDVDGVRQAMYDMGRSNRVPSAKGEDGTLRFGTSKNNKAAPVEGAASSSPSPDQVGKGS